MPGVTKRQRNLLIGQPLCPCPRSELSASPDERVSRAWNQAGCTVSPTLPVLSKDEILAVADAIAERFADFMYSSQPGEKGVPTVSRQSIRNQERLLEHAHQRSEVTFVVISNVATEPSGALAIENHQLCHSDGIADSLLVTGNGFLGLYDGRILPAKHVRPEPPVYRLLVWLLDILSQVKAGVKKRLIIFVRSVEERNGVQRLTAIGALSAL